MGLGILKLFTVHERLGKLYTVGLRNCLAGLHSAFMIFCYPGRASGMMMTFFRIGGNHIFGFWDEWVKRRPEVYGLECASVSLALRHLRFTLYIFHLTLLYERRLTKNASELLIFDLQPG